MRTGEHDPGPDSGAESGPPSTSGWTPGQAFRTSPWGEDPDARHPGRAGRPGRGLWFPVVLALLVQIPGLVIAARLHGDALAVVAALLGVGAALSLLARRRHPGPVVAVAGALAASSIAFGSGPPFAAVPLAFAVLAGVIRGARAWVWCTLAGVAVIVPLGAYLLTSSPVSIIRPLIVAVLLCLLVGIGEAVRTQRERYRNVSRQVAERRQSAAEAERLRIARELHDVLAHSLSQISVQAGVGLHLFETKPEKARASLEAIKSTSGQALEEVRGVLGFLRDEGDAPSRSPAPDLARIPNLVESFRRGGLAVTFEDRLGPGIPSATQLAIYRIVQESLTNAARHSGASTVAVTMAVDEDSAAEVDAAHTPGRAPSSRWVVRVVDDGRGPDPEAEPGRGLTGIRERAELLGGRMSVGAAEGGGFRVEVSLPAVRRGVGGAGGYAVGPGVGPAVGPAGPAVAPAAGPAVGPAVGPTGASAPGPAAGPTAPPAAGPTSPTAGSSAVPPAAGPAEGPTALSADAPIVPPTGAPTEQPAAGPTPPPADASGVPPAEGPTVPPAVSRGAGPVAPPAGDPGSAPEGPKP